MNPDQNFGGPVPPKLPVKFCLFLFFIWGGGRRHPGPPDRLWVKISKLNEINLTCKYC